MRNLFILLITLFMVTSCAPSSKEEYLERYKKFMDEVTENYKTYSPEQWEMANEKFARFNNQWYLKFRPNLTWTEKATIAGYQLKYQGLRVACELGTFYDGLKLNGTSYAPKAVLLDNLWRHLTISQEVKLRGSHLRRVEPNADRVNNNTHQYPCTIPAVIAVFIFQPLGCNYKQTLFARD